jgi:hypothetical protein
MAFPNTSVLDDFNRSNQQLDASPDWVQAPPDDDSMRIVSNQAEGNTSGTYFGNLWDNALSSDDHEAYITIATKNGADNEVVAAVYLRVSGTGASETGYYCYATRKSGTDQIDVDSFTGTSFSSAGSSQNQEISDGDVFGAEIIGSTIKVYINGSEVGTWTDSTYSTGKYIGFGVQGNTTEFDDFGGGVPTTPSARIMTPNRGYW